MNNKLKHLEFIQAVITRLAGNSFLLKGWSVTLVSAIFALAAKDGKPSLIPVAYLPAVMFWFLDGYFLRHERLFRKLYDFVRAAPQEPVDFSLDTSPFANEVRYFLTLFSITLRWFHGVLLLTIIMVQFLAR